MAVSAVEGVVAQLCECGINSPEAMGVVDRYIIESTDVVSAALVLAKGLVAAATLPVAPPPAPAPLPSDSAMTDDVDVDVEGRSGRRGAPPLGVLMLAHFGLAASALSKALPPGRLSPALEDIIRQMVLDIPIRFTARLLEALCGGVGNSMRVRDSPSLTSAAVEVARAGLRDSAYAYVVNLVIGSSLVDVFDVEPLLFACAKNNLLGLLNKLMNVEVIPPVVKGKAVRWTSQYQKPKAAWKLIIEHKLDPNDFPDVKRACALPELIWLVKSLTLQDAPVWEYNHQVIASLIDAFLRRNPELAGDAVDALLKRCGPESPIVRRFVSLLHPRPFPGCARVRLMAMDEIRAFDNASLAPPPDGGVPLYALPPGLPINWIDTPDALTACCTFLAKFPNVAFDCEWLTPGSASLDSRIVADVLQLACSEHVFLVDVLTLSKLIPSHCFAMDAAFKLIFLKRSHSTPIDSLSPKLVGFSCSGDLSALAAALPGLGVFRDGRTDNVLDLMVPAGTLGLGKQPTLAAVTKALLGCTLDKRSQISDWMSRPLRSWQMAYAAADAYVLLDLCEKLCPAVPSPRGVGGAGGGGASPVPPLPSLPPPPPGPDRRGGSTYRGRGGRGGTRRGRGGKGGGDA